MKITDYEKVTELLANNVLLVDGDGGTKTILARDLLKALVAVSSSQDYLAKMDISQLTQVNTVSASDRILLASGGSNKGITVNDAFWGILDAVISVEQRRNIFRGKNLGTAFTAAQKAEIKAGTFKGFFIGDYWSIGDRIWRIVDINYWLNSGDASCTTPHLVIMPDQSLYSAKMNETNITTGGYVGSQMYTANLANAKTLVNSAFGSANILNHREYLTNAVTNGYPSAGAWYDSTVELPNEIMMYGSLVFTPAGDGSFVPNRYTIDKTQLALMKMYPRFINPGRYWYWLRDVVSSALFAHVGGLGAANYNDASASGGVRPVFGLVG
ncbi:hypothetical protein HLY09_25400 [Enterocloster bolteae]|uniref:hypothetical protein n=1 Tax=Enterocloster bolteae TaxID=208479 RepID=UPI00148D38BD|nr:hypothetical protein [Enterocloster bolteae]QJU22477.1 hypothetical protein HLY09_25400 [Enterocloster bolteae]